MRTKTEGNDRLIHQGELATGMTWSSWSPLRGDQIRYVVPEEYGIYKLRQAGGKAVPRFVGESEILYIGRSGISRTRTLKKRLLELVGGQHVAWPRVHRVQEGRKVSLEYSYAVTQDPALSEKLLLMLYEKEHYELPPLNHIGGL